MHSPPRSRPLPRLLLAVVAAAGVACGGSRATEPTTTGGGELRRGELTVRTLLTGELVAEESVALVTPNVDIWPLEIRWLVAPGEAVAAGDRVVEFDGSELLSRLEDLRSRRDGAQSRLTTVEAQTAEEEEQAQLELERKQAAFEKARLEATVPAEILSEVEHERRQLELHRAELELGEARRALDAARRIHQAEVAIERIEVEQAEAELERTRTTLERLTLRAPRPGIVLIANNPRESGGFEVGDSIYPRVVVARIPDLSTLAVEARLFDVDDGRVRPGMPVRATLDAFPGETLTGTVRSLDRIARSPDRPSSRRFFQLRIDLEGIDPERMRPGMSVRVVVEEHLDDALLVPRTRLRWDDHRTEMRLDDGTWEPVELAGCDPWSCALAETPAEATEATEG
jgi:multidrug efflux pump subunit AcrA (membrane-fusion protein)